MSTGRMTEVKDRNTEDERSSAASVDFRTPCWPAPVEFA
jgi:hypothetical protein